MVQYLTLRLLGRGAIEFDKFPLRVLREYLKKHPDVSVPLSPISFNLRHKPIYPVLDKKEECGGPLDWEDIFQIGECLYRMARLHNVWADFVLEVPWGSTMLAEAFARTARDDGKCITVVSFPKGFVYKDWMRYEGTALIIEDVLTFGSSVLRFIASTVRPIGLRVNACLAFFDREQGAMQALARAGISSYVLSSSSAVVDFLASCELIDPEMRETVLKYPARLKQFCEEHRLNTDQ